MIGLIRAALARVEWDCGPVLRPDLPGGCAFVNVSPGPHDGAGAFVIVAVEAEPEYFDAAEAAGLEVAR